MNRRRVNEVNGDGDTGCSSPEGILKGRFDIKEEGHGCRKREIC